MELLNWLIVLALFYLGHIEGACPPTVGALQRVGHTRFYILHHPTRGDFSDWNHAKDVCQKNGMVLGTIKSIIGLAGVGRALERLVNQLKLKDTWYWLNAKFDKNMNRYIWLDDNQPLNFTNFFYRQPRPTGVGSHVSWSNNYNVKAEVDQCLALALPYPGLIDAHEYGVVFGHSTSIEERPCVSSQSRHAICESKDAECRKLVTDHYELSEADIKQKYFDEGNWIIGDRKYIVNWAQRDFEASKKYCESLGLKLFNPTLHDTCLIPYIKMWSRNITLSQFWTGWKYIVATQEFKNAEGKTVATTNASNVAFKEGAEVRSSKSDADFCVAMYHAYEFKRQMPCPNPGSNSPCDWNFINYVPANCFNPQGVVCQHPNPVDRKCVWKQTYIKNISIALEETATLSFGWKNNIIARRSRYKQTFGSFICPDGYRMMRFNNTKWHTAPATAGTQPFIYDYKESYWVVDQEGFKKNQDSLCTVSKPVGDGKSRKNEKVPCLEWHFYLCEKVIGTLKKRETQPTVPTWNWDDRPTRRTYPIQA